MSRIYPETNDDLYYVEFERGNLPGEYTLFKRQWMYSKKEWESMMKDVTIDFAMSLIRNEVHPWNIFTSKYGPPGTMPDETWVKFMVDALNEKVVRNEDMKERFDTTIQKIVDNKLGEKSP